jgi:hypothetical protein
MRLIADTTLQNDWLIGFVIAVVVVVVVVILLLTIYVGARRILRAALRCLAAVENIRKNTLPLWDLTTTNAVAGQLDESANSIKRHAEALAGALEATEHQEARR